METVASILGAWWFVLASGVYGGSQMTVVGPFPNKPACEEVTKAIDISQSGWGAPKSVYLHCWDGGEASR